MPTDEVGRLTATINDMLGRLEGSFETQQRLVADVSHELRTPLTTIQGNLDLLRRGAADDPAMRGEALRRDRQRDGAHAPAGQRSAAAGAGRRRA